MTGNPLLYRRFSDWATLPGREGIDRSQVCGCIHRRFLSDQRLTIIASEISLSSRFRGDYDVCVENPCNIRLTSNDWQRGSLYRRVAGRRGRGRELGLLKGVRESSGGRGTGAAAVAAAAAAVPDVSANSWRSGVSIGRGGCGGRTGCRSRGRLLLLLLRRRDCTVGVCVSDPGRKLMLLLHLLDHLRRRRWRRRHHLRHLVLRRLQQEERWRGGGGGRGGGRGRLEHLVSTWLLLLQQILLLLLRLLLRPSSTLVSKDHIGLLRLAGNLKST